MYLRAHQPGFKAWAGAQAGPDEWWNRMRSFDRPPLVPAEAGTQALPSIVVKELDSRLRGNERSIAYPFNQSPIRFTASCISAAEPA
jgi:hypothetical protein